METLIRRACHMLLIRRRSGKMRIVLELAVAYCAGIITSILLSKLASSSSLFSNTYPLLLLVLQSSTNTSTWLFSPWTWSLYSSQLGSSMTILFILILSSIFFFYNYSRNTVGYHHDHHHHHDDGSCNEYFPSSIPPPPPSSQQPPILLIKEVKSYFQDDVRAAAETAAAPVVTTTVQVIASSSSSSSSRSCANIIVSNIINETTTPESSHDDLLHAFPFVSPPLIQLLDHHHLFNTNDSETKRTSNYEGRRLVGDIREKEEEDGSCCCCCCCNDANSDQDNYSLEVTWNTINKEGTGGRKPKKSTAAAAATTSSSSRDYCYNVPPKSAAAKWKSNLKAWQELRKAETFNDAVFGWRRGGLRRGTSLTREEVNLQAEAFIKNFKRHTACRDKKQKSNVSPRMINPAAS